MWVLGKNLCRNFHELGALSSVVDLTQNGKAMACSIASDAIITDNFDDILWR